MSDADLERVLRQLRTTYVAEGPRRLAELDAALGLLGSGTPGAATDLARLFHRLAGSGGSYGLDAVTSTARAGEQLADGLAASGAAPTSEQLAELRAQVSALGAAFEAARTQDFPPLV